MTPDPKPGRRIVDRAAGREKVRAEGRCRLCDRTDVERHHLVPRSLGGDDVDDNLIPLCPMHHGGFEHEGKRPVIGSQIRHALLPPELAYVCEEKGYAFLERYYPISCPAMG